EEQPKEHGSEKGPVVDDASQTCAPSDPRRTEAPDLHTAVLLVARELRVGELDVLRAAREHGHYGSRRGAILREVGQQARHGRLVGPVGERNEGDRGARERFPGRTARGRRQPVLSACSRYQATVRRSPSVKGVVAVQPKSSFARETSSRRLGWPLGFEVSQTMRPGYPTSAATREARSRIEISCPEPRLIGSAPS